MGGSSDAATTLLALNRLWGSTCKDMRWPRSVCNWVQMFRFLCGLQRLGEGIGETITPLEKAHQLPTERAL